VYYGIFKGTAHPKMKNFIDFAHRSNTQTHTFFLSVGLISFSLIFSMSLLIQLTVTTTSIEMIFSE